MLEPDSSVASMGQKEGLHLGIIMDGNGRWAQRRGLPRTAGHLRGVRTVRKVVQVAAQLENIRVLTLYAFSADNWGRPPAEVETLMSLLKEYLGKETSRCLKEGIRLNVIGRRDRLNPALLASIEHSEASTRQGEALLLRLAVDYSSREALLKACAYTGGSGLNQERFSGLLEQACHSVPGAGPVDLVIRTGGEKRLSDFLLWESAYAELYFTDVLWPDFTEATLAQALADFQGRQRRFGKIPALEALRA